MKRTATSSDWITMHASPTPLAALPTSYLPTRDALHALACFVIAPYRKTRTGRIGLRPTAGGFGTPPFDDGTRLVVRGDRLEVFPGRAFAVTTLRAAASDLGLALEANPGIGHDLPPFLPDALLDIDPAATAAIGAWYRFGEQILDELAQRPDATATPAQIWPEHFDLAVELTGPGLESVNVGFSPGDEYHAMPYVYVGPSNRASLTDQYWNAPFGAVLGYDALVASLGHYDATLAFIEHGLALLRAPVPR
jgi:hypothetical protein